MENNYDALHLKPFASHTTSTGIPCVFYPLPSALTLSLSLSAFLWTVGPRILLEPHPDAPWLLKNSLTKNITQMHRHTESTHDVIRQQSVCVLCVCHCLSLPPQTLCRKPVSRGHSQRASQPLWQPDLAALRKLHPATQTTHQPQQRFSADC